MRITRPILLLLLSLFFCQCVSTKNKFSAIEKGLLQDKINGMALASSPCPFKVNPIPQLEGIGVNWIGIQPFAFFCKDKPQIKYVGYQWWGERKEGIIKTVELARASGMRILLKPQLWAYNQWIGDLKFDKESDWLIFETNYRNYILPMAKLADSLDVEIFSVGTEVKLSAIRRPQFWRTLIEDIRKIYKGKLIYASNWDGYHAVTFWDVLDYVGIDAYFPLIKDKSPKVDVLKKAWIPTVDSIQTFYEKWQRPILFTEFGYMSMEGCAYKAWLLEKEIKECPVNEQAQANALQALLETFGQKEWWAGGFQWKWYADVSSALSKDEAARDYTPQGKMAEDVLKQLYNKQELEIEKK